MKINDIKTKPTKNDVGGWGQNKSEATCLYSFQVAFPSPQCHLSAHVTILRPSASIPFNTLSFIAPL